MTKRLPDMIGTLFLVAQAAAYAPLPGMLRSRPALISEVRAAPAPVEQLETEAEAAGPVSGVIPFEPPAASTNNAAAWQSAEPVVGTDQGPGIAPRNPEEFSSTSLLLIDEDDPLAAMMG